MIVTGISYLLLVPDACKSLAFYRFSKKIVQNVEIEQFVAEMCTQAGHFYTAGI